MVIWEGYADSNKKELSGFKTLEKDRFGDFLKIFENFEFFSMKRFKEIIGTKKVMELHFTLAYQLSKHWDQ